MVSLAAVLFAALSVHAQETNEEVVGRFENEQIVLTKVVALADHFRNELENDGKLSELTATLLPDQKHVYVLSGKSTLAKSMEYEWSG